MECNRVNARQYPRYLVSGTASLACGRSISEAEVVQLGYGGMLLRGGKILPIGATGIAKFRIAQHRNVVQTPFEIVGERNALMALKFQRQPLELAEVIQWLAIGKFSIAGEAKAAEMRCCTSIPKYGKTKDREALIEYLYS